MLGLFNKKKGDLGLLLDWNEYNSRRDKLLALLEKDIKIINQEKKSLVEAIKALKNSGRTNAKHLSIIKKRLELVHSRLLLADELVEEETKNLPVETTTLSELFTLVDKIATLAIKKRGG